MNNTAATAGRGRKAWSFAARWSWCALFCLLLLGSLQRHIGSIEQLHWWFRGPVAYAVAWEPLVFRSAGRDGVVIFPEAAAPTEDSAIGSLVLYGENALALNFHCSQKYLTGFDIRINTGGAMAGNGGIEWVLKRRRGDQLVRRGVVPTRGLMDWGFLPIRFAALENSNGRDFRLILESRNEPPIPIGVTFYSRTGMPRKLRALLLNSEIGVAQVLHEDAIIDGVALYRQHFD